MKKAAQRARKPEDKAKRSKKILQVAWGIYEESEGTFPTVSDIARRAGLAKGTIYLYFSTKEEIFLQLFLLKLEEWVEFSLLKLKKVRNADIAIRKVSRAITQYPLKNPSFLKLASTIKSVVDENSNDEAVFQSRTRIAKLLDYVYRELHDVFPCVPRKRIASTYIYRSILAYYRFVPDLHHIRRYKAAPEG
ncbi:MAG: helix-turn-helix domain-containing protein [Actinomycetota bacterium]|nr:helix-turn-helix domain-containing protein [Actinomycetota bacterium]